MQNLLSICESIFGKYQPIITTIDLADGTQKIIQSVDIGYISGVVVFCIAFTLSFVLLARFLRGYKNV